MSNIIHRLKLVPQNKLDELIETGTIDQRDIELFIKQQIVRENFKAEEIKNMTPEDIDNFVKAEDIKRLFLDNGVSTENIRYRLGINKDPARKAEAVQERDIVTARAIEKAKEKTSVQEENGERVYNIYTSSNKDTLLLSFRQPELTDAIATLEKRGNMKFQTLEQTVEKFAIEKRQEGSHIMFNVPFLTRPINIQPEGNLAKPAQIKTVRKAFKLMLRELSTMAPNFSIK